LGGDFVWREFDSAVNPRYASRLAMKVTNVLLISATCTLLLTAVHAQDQPYLYKATLVQAAPGKIVELIDLYKQKNSGNTGDTAPFWMRHSQGDHWDLLLLYPVGSYADYYRAERIATRDKSAHGLDDKLAQAIAWQEDVFVYGPPIEDVRKAFDGAGYFHVEMFVALAGKRPDLFKQRQMENTYSRNLKQPENLIFVRDQGAAWDLFTIGCYRNLKHYAEGSDVPQKEADAAAKAAGFESADRIGPYLRTLIQSHHDTLAGAVR
jgi:hypothetical protein